LRIFRCLESKLGTLPSHDPVCKMCGLEHEPPIAGLYINNIVIVVKDEWLADMSAEELARYGERGWYDEIEEYRERQAASGAEQET
jgi:hypothetical protein